MLFVMGILGTSRNQASGELAMSLIDASLTRKLAGRTFAAPSGSGLVA